MATRGTKASRNEADQEKGNGDDAQSNDDLLGPVVENVLQPEAVTSDKAAAGNVERS